MKHLLFLLFCFSAFAQSDNVSVVSAEKMNIVYRGVPNPIKIAVPGAKSFTATAPGLVKLDSLGNYKLSPGSGNEVIINIEAQMEDGSLLKENKTIRIKSLYPISASLYGEDCFWCTFRFTRQELIEAKIELQIKDFLLIDKMFEVISFKLKFPNGKEITVEGNTMSTDAIKLINKTKVNTLLIIDNIRYGNDPNIEYRRIRPLHIVLTNKSEFRD